MKMTYRGVHYDYTPPQIDLDGASLGRTRTNSTHLNYRGVSYTQPVASVGMTPETDLTYRGVSYHVGCPEQVTVPSEMPVAKTTSVTIPAVVSTVEPVEAAPATVAVASAVVSADERARMLMMSHHRSVKLRQQTMLFRLATAVGVPAEDASHYWTSIQGKVQPSFWATYDRSHTSAS